MGARDENTLLEQSTLSAYVFRPGDIQPMHCIWSKTRPYQSLYSVMAPLHPVWKALLPAFVSQRQRAEVNAASRPWDAKGDRAFITLAGLVPPHRAPALFKPMTPGTTTVTERRSVGLCLFIVEQVARAHGGQVEVVSTAEAGTTFRVHLPRGD